MRKVIQLELEIDSAHSFNAAMILRLLMESHHIYECFSSPTEFKITHGKVLDESNFSIEQRGGEK